MAAAQGVSGVKPVLRLVSLNASIPHIDVFAGATLTLGRAPGSALGAVTIPLQSVSSRHASVKPNGAGGLIVTDLGSSNGTFVNRSMRLEAHVPITLTHGMELSLVLPRSRKSMVLEDDVSFVVHDMSVINSGTWDVWCGEGDDVLGAEIVPGKCGVLVCLWPPTPSKHACQPSAV